LSVERWRKITLPKYQWLFAAQFDQASTMDDQIDFMDDLAGQDKAR
jgi:hypothetical protein